MRSRSQHIGLCSQGGGLSCCHLAQGSNLVVLGPKLCQERSHTNLRGDKLGLDGFLDGVLLRRTTTERQRTTSGCALLPAEAIEDAVLVQQPAGAKQASCHGNRISKHGREMGLLVR